MDPLLKTLFDSSVSGSWLFPLAIGLAAMLLVWGGVRTSAALVSPMRRRMGALRDVEVAAAPSAAGGPRKGLFARLEPRNEAKRSGMRLRLVQAGFRSPEAVGTLYAIKFLTTLLLPAAVYVGLLAMPALRAVPVLMILFLGLAVMVGWLLPNAFVDHRRESRRAELMAGLPDALDLLVACTEAGLGLNAALERVVEQMPASHPALAHELGMVNAEIRAGVDRTTALRNLAERSGMDEIRGLVSLITHSAKLGTGIAATLRIYSEEFRDRRMQQAEEMAAKIGTKLILPLVGFLWPAFFIVATGPAIIGVMRAMSGVALPGSQ